VSDEEPVPLEEQLEHLRRNYVSGAIDLVTYLGAVEDVYAGVPNSYAQAGYGTEHEL